MSLASRPQQAASLFPLLTASQQRPGRPQQWQAQRLVPAALLLLAASVSIETAGASRN